MADNKIVPWYPFYCRDGAKIISKYEKRPVYSHGHLLTEHWCTYVDKKGKIQDAWMYVVWDK